MPLQTISKLSVSTSRQNSNRTLDANKQSRVTIDLRDDCDQRIWHRSERTFSDAEGLWNSIASGGYGWARIMAEALFSSVV